MISSPSTDPVVYEARTHPESEVHQYLDNYFRLLITSFERIAAKCNSTDFSRSLAGHAVRIRCAGESLHKALTRALNHLPQAEPYRFPSLEIMGWDEKATGESLPPPPWSWSDPSQEARLVLPKGGEAFRMEVVEKGRMFLVHSLRRNKTICWTRDAESLPTYLHASPLLKPLHWWSFHSGLTLVHAGSVATEHGAVLLAGPGGSGKSTTALLCALQGLDYLSDDYSLVLPGPRPEAYCLFSSGKLHRNHLERFPSLLPRSEDPTPDQYGKPVIFMHEHFPARIATSRPLKAVLAPRVSGLPDTRLHSIPASEALRALAPSTLFQLPLEGPESLRNMAALVRRLPCYRLELGTDLGQIPSTIAGLLRTLA